MDCIYFFSHSVLCFIRWRDSFVVMKELKTEEEAVDFVINQLHTCRVIDTTWDEYIELTLRLGIKK